MPFEFLRAKIGRLSDMKIRGVWNYEMERELSAAKQELREKEYEWSRRAAQWAAEKEEREKKKAARRR